MVKIHHASTQIPGITAMVRPLPGPDFPRFLNEATAPSLPALRASTLLAPSYPNIICCTQHAHKTAVHKIDDWTLKVPHSMHGLQDFHIVSGRPEVMIEFQRAHNDDEYTKVEPWVPASFEDTPELTKRRKMFFKSQIKAPGWLKKMLGVHMPAPPLVLPTTCTRLYTASACRHSACTLTMAWQSAE